MRELSQRASTLRVILLAQSLENVCKFPGWFAIRERVRKDEQMIVSTLDQGEGMENHKLIVYRKVAPRVAANRLTVNPG